MADKVSNPGPVGSPALTDEFLVTTAREAGFTEREWRAMFYDTGPYDVTRPTVALQRFAELILKHAAKSAAVHPDTQRLDFVENECVELRCQVSRGQDDADVFYEAVKFYQAKPRERIVGIGSTPRKAIDSAIRDERPYDSEALGAWDAAA